MKFDFKAYCKNCNDDKKLNKKQVKIKDRYPMGIERSLNKRVRDELLRVNREIKLMVQAELRRMPRQDSLMRADGYIDRFNNFADALIAKVTNDNTHVARGQKGWIDKFAEDIKKWNTKQFVGEVNKELGVDFYLPDSEVTNELVQGWVTTNDKVIKRYQTETINEIREQVSRDYMAGLRAEEIEKKLFGTFSGDKNILSEKKAKNKARIWARNEVGNLNSNLTQQRQEELGIEMAEWQTSGDERVRCEHRAYDGKTYPVKEGITVKWLQDNGIPATCSQQVSVKQPNGSFKTQLQSGNRVKEIEYYGGRIFAGSPINCRCVSISVIDF